MPSERALDIIHVSAKRYDLDIENVYQWWKHRVGIDDLILFLAFARGLVVVVVIIVVVVVVTVTALDLSMMNLAKHIISILDKYEKIAKTLRIELHSLLSLFDLFFHGLKLFFSSIQVYGHILGDLEVSMIEKVGTLPFSFCFSLRQRCSLGLVRSGRIRDALTSSLLRALLVILKRW